MVSNLRLGRQASRLRQCFSQTPVRPVPWSVSGLVGRQQPHVASFSSREDTPISTSTKSSDGRSHVIQFWEVEILQLVYDNAPQSVVATLSPERCHHVIDQYLQSIKKTETPDHTANLTADLVDHGISPQEIYDAGITIFPIETTNNYARQIPFNMMVSAAALGCLSAVMSVAIVSIFRDQWGAETGRTGRPRPAWSTKNEARFKKFLASNPRNANAVFIHGLALQHEKKHVGAEKHFRRALEELDGPEFEWRPWCQLSLAKSCLELGKPDEARRLFEDLDAQGYDDCTLELGRMLRPVDRDAAEGVLLRASRIREHAGQACNELAEISWERSFDTTDPQKQQNAGTWAMQWSGLASAWEKIKQDRPRK